MDLRAIADEFFGALLTPVLQRAVRSAAVGDAASALVRHLPRRMRSDGLETVNVRTSRGTTVPVTTPYYREKHARRANFAQETAYRYAARARAAEPSGWSWRKKRGPKTKKGRNRFHTDWKEPKLLILYVVGDDGRPSQTWAPAAAGESPPTSGSK